MSLYSPGKARKSLLDTIAFRALSQMATAASLVILVRGMTKEDFGVYSLLLAFIPVVSTVASLGLEQVLRRYQPEYLNAGNITAAAWLVKVVALGRFVTNIVVLSIVLAGWNYIAPIFKLTPYKFAFASFALLILLYFQTRILQLALGSHMLHRYSVGSIALQSFVKLLSYSLLFAFGTLSLERVILVDTIAYGLAYILMRVVYRRRCMGSGESSYNPPPTERKRLIRYGLFNNFNDAGVLLLYSTMDNFFIAAFIDTVSVGIYAFYTRLNEMMTNVLPVKLFDNVVQPLFFSVRSEDADRKLPQYFTFLLNMNLLAQWPFFAFALSYHAEIVQLVFGGKFIEHSWLFPVLVGFATLNVVDDAATLVAQYREKAGVVLFSKIFAVYNVAAMALLVPALGVYGAALASGTAQVMKNGFIWWHVRRSAVWTNAWRVLACGIGIWGAAVLVCLSLKSLVDVPVLVQLLMGAVVFCMAGMLYVRSSALSSSDRQILATVMKGKGERALRYVGLLPPEIQHLPKV